MSLFGTVLARGSGESHEALLFCATRSWLYERTERHKGDSIRGGAGGVVIQSAGPRGHTARDSFRGAAVGTVIGTAGARGFCEDVREFVVGQGATSVQGTALVPSRPERPLTSASSTDRAAAREEKTRTRKTFATSSGDASSTRRDDVGKDKSVRN